VIISELCRDLSAYVMISVHGMTAAAPSGRIAAMSAQPSCGMEDSSPRVYPSIFPGSGTGYRDLVTRSLREDFLATSHQSIDPKYGRLSIVLCQASEFSHALMRALHDLSKSGGDTGMSSLVLLTRLGVLADVSCMLIKTNNNNEGLIKLLEEELASFRYSQGHLYSVGIIPQFTLSSYMNRLDGSQVPICNDAAKQIVRILCTITREE